LLLRFYLVVVGRKTLILKSIENTNRASFGFLLIEFLLVIFISMIALALAVNHLGFLTKTLFKSLERVEEDEAMLKLMELLDVMNGEIDYHLLPLWPRIHKRGYLTLSDGTPLKVNTHPSFSPDSESSAISYVELEPQQIYSIFNNRGNKGVICINNPICINNFKLTERYLGIDSEHVGVFKLIESKAVDKALELSFIQEPSIALPTFTTFLPKTIFPIKREYTIYRDAKKILRFITHSGPLTLENQPIAAWSPTFNLTPSFDSDGSFYTLSFELIREEGKDQLIRAFKNTIARSSLAFYAANNFS
jgi:hypothetical protein